MFASDVQPFSPDGWQMFFTDDFNRSYAPEWQFGDHLIRQFYDHSALFFYDPALWAVPPTPDLFDLRIQLRANVSLDDLRMRWRESGSGFYELILTPSGLLELQRSGTSVTSANMQIPSDWVLLTMTMVGDTLSVDLDETPSLLYSDPELLPSGRVSFSGALSEMDDFTLWVPPDMVVPPTNTAPFPLTPADCTTASLPLNGETMLIFSAIPTGAQVNAIFVMNPDGSGRQPLLACPVGLAGPRISPDGTQIVFAASGLFSTYPDLYVLRVDGGVYADGSIIRQITFDSAAERAPAWSPDGTKIVFASNRSNPGIYVLDIASLAVAPLNSIEPYGQLGHVLPHHLDWSPDGSRILFEKIVTVPSVDANIASLDYPSATVSTVISDLPPFRWEEVARWSSDGSSIVFGWSQGSIHGISQYVPASGSETLWRTTGYASFDWSPDSSQIVYSTYPGANLFVGPAYASSGDVQISFANTDFHVDWGIRPPCSPGGSGQGGGAGGMQLSAICLPVTPTPTPTSTPSPTGTCTVVLTADVYGYADPAAAIQGDTSAALVLLSTGTSVLAQARWDGNENYVKAVRVGEVSPVFWFNSGDGNVTLPRGEDCNDLPFETQAGQELSTYGIEAPNRDQVLALLGGDPNYATTLFNSAGVTTSNVIDWQSGEVNRIHQGAVDIALAFTHVRDGIALQAAFRQGMGIDANGGSAARGVIRFIRASHLPYCVNVLNAIPRTIVCGTIARGFSHYLAVHELGHVFDNQADQGGNQSVNEYVTMPGAVVLDSDGFWVLGTHSDVFCELGLPRAPAGWARGERGWGSGPGSVYGIQGLDERCQTPNAPNFTHFQQNPPPYQVAPGLTPQQVAAQETGADMFLNWVFRVQERGGFENRNWKPLDQDPLTGLYCNTIAAGCPDDRNPGNARLTWMSTYMTATLQRLIP